MVRDFYRQFGIDQKIQRIVKESVDMTIRSIRIHPGPSELFKKLKDQEGSYLSNHSILLAHVSCSLATQMEWVSTTTSSKLVMAAFLHDITLDDPTPDVNIIIAQHLHRCRLNLRSIKKLSQGPIEIERIPCPCHLPRRMH